MTDTEAIMRGADVASLKENIRKAEDHFLRVIGDHTGLDLVDSGEYNEAGKKIRDAVRAAGEVAIQFGINRIAKQRTEEEDGITPDEQTPANRIEGDTPIE